MGDVLVKRYSAPNEIEQALDDATERPVAPKPKVKRIGGEVPLGEGQAIPADSPLFHGEGKEEGERIEEDREYPTKMVKVIKAKRPEHEDMSWDAVMGREKKRKEREKREAAAKRIREEKQRRADEPEPEDEYYYPTIEEMKQEDKERQRAEMEEIERLNAETPPPAPKIESVESKEYQGKVKEAVAGTKPKPERPEEKEPEIHAGDDKPAMSRAEWLASPEKAARDLARQGREGQSTRTATKQGKHGRRQTVNILDAQERAQRAKEASKRQQAIDRKIAQERKKKLNVVAELPEGGTRDTVVGMKNPPIVRAHEDEHAPFSPEHKKLFGSEFSKYIPLAGLLENMIFSDPHGTAALWEDGSMNHLPQYKQEMDNNRNKMGKLNSEGHRIKDKLVEQMMMSMRGGEHNAILDQLGLRIADPKSEMEFGQSGPYMQPSETWLAEQLSGLRGEHADAEAAQEAAFQGRLERTIAGMDMPEEHHGEFEQRIREKMEEGMRADDAYQEVINHMRSMGQIDPRPERPSEEEAPYAEMSHGDWQRHDPQAARGAKRQGPAMPRSTTEEDIAATERMRRREQREKEQMERMFREEARDRIREGLPSIEEEMAATREQSTGTSELQPAPEGGDKSLFDLALRSGAVGSAAEWNQMQIAMGTPEKMVSEAEPESQAPIPPQAPPAPVEEDEEEKLASFGGPSLGEQLLKSILKHMYTGR